MQWICCTKISVNQGRQRYEYSSILWSCNFRSAGSDAVSRCSHRHCPGGILHLCHSSGTEPGGFRSYGRAENFLRHLRVQSAGHSLFYPGRQHHEQGRHCHPPNQFCQAVHRQHSRRPGSYQRRGQHALWSHFRFRHSCCLCHGLHHRPHRG